MIDYPTFCELHRLHEQLKLSVGQIARELKLDEKTVAKWVQEKTYRPAKRPKRSSKLDPFKGRILGWLERHAFTAQQILQRLRQEGFAGGYSIVKDFVRQVRPAAQPAFLTLHFAPGECLQVDWGSFGTIPVGSTQRRLSFFAAVLCYSRMLYVEFTLSQSQEHFLAAQERAFQFFKGIPQKVMVDNCKTAVLNHPFGQAPQFNARYLDFARHYGFEIRACGVRQAHEKGRVENAVGYVKKNFLAGLELPPWPGLNAAATHWLESVANVRVHGQTHQTPLELFAQEQKALRPISVLPYDTATIRQVRANNRFRVLFETNRYSVPAHLAGAALSLKTYSDRLCLDYQNQRVAEHARSFDRHQDIEHPDHVRALIAQRHKARDQQLLGRFLALCPKAQDYYVQLEQRRLNARHHVQKILALAEIYPRDQVARALEDALEYHAYSCEYIANILEQRQRQLPEAGALHLTRAGDALDIQLPEPDLSIYQTPEDQP